MRCLPSSICFLAWDIPLTTPNFFVQFDWPIAKEGWNYGGAPKKKILWKHAVTLPLAQLYRWEEEDFGQNIWNESKVPSGTPMGNTLGTCYEHRKNEKNPPLAPPCRNLKENNRLVWVQAEPFHWLHGTSIPKTVFVTIFNLH
jgi:hypothetical protein